MVIFMFQCVLDSINIHITPDLNQFLIRVTKKFRSNQLIQGIIPKAKAKDYGDDSWNMLL